MSYLARSRYAHAYALHRALFIALLLCACDEARAAEGVTAGWCAVEPAPSSIYASIVCRGVTSRALSRLNDLLDRSGLTLAEQLAQAERWTRLYADCNQRLHRMADHGPALVSLADLEEQGRFEEAGALLEQALESADRSPAQRAEYRFVRAEILSLQFRDADALAHYERAFRDAPDVFEYAFGYAEALRQAQRSEKADSAYQHALSLARGGDPSHAMESSKSVAMTLTSLAMLSRERGRVRESEQAYREALQIYRRLGEDSCAIEIAEVLNHLGVLYHLNQQSNEAEVAYQEAAAIYHVLAKAQPEAYLPDEAGTLANLTVLYRDRRRKHEAQWAARAALEAYRELVNQGVEAYLPDLANTLNGLGVLYHTSGRLDEAESAYREALEVYRSISQSWTTDYRAELAGVLNNLGVLCRDTERTLEASRALREASQIRSVLASRKPRLYMRELMQTLMNLEKVYRQMGWTYEAREVSARLEKLGAIP